MDNLGVVGAVQSKGISAAAFRIINTKKLEFKVFNKTEKCIYNMKKYGDISTLSTGDKIKSNEMALLTSQGNKSNLFFKNAKSKLNLLTNTTN